MRSYFQRHASAADRVVVRLDFENAFNSISRAAVLAAAAAHFPHLARWATWCYQEPSILQFGDSVWDSTAGVQRKDPLRPLLAHVEARAAAIGLRLNLAKSVAVLVGAAAEESLRGHLPQELLVYAAGASRISRNLEPLLAAMPLWNSTHKPGQTRQLLCWTPSRSLTTRKWACAFCAPVLAMRASSTASDVLPRKPNLLLCSTSTNECRPALLASPAST